MLKSSVWGKQALPFHFSAPVNYVILTTAFALILGGMLGVAGIYALLFALGAMALSVIVVLRWDALNATLIVLFHLYLDYYLNLALTAQIMTLFLLLIFLLARSPQRPWVEPRALWLWALFLVLAIFPAFHGIEPLDSVYYYFNVIFIAPVIFWLGLLVGRDTASVRRLFELLTLVATLLAIHAIIQAFTGVFLFKTSRYDAELIDVNYFQLTGTGIARVQGFFLNPDVEGSFFAILPFISLGLFVETSSLAKKILFLVETIIMLPALLFTYSTGAWIAGAAGLLFFIVFVGVTRYRVLIPMVLGISVMFITVLFPSQAAAQLSHVSAPYEWPLRIGGWKTALNVIQAFPWTGLGMGRRVYIVRADPYRAPQQFIPLYHPHNSYLEFATQGGIPLAIVFMVLLGIALWLALRNWFGTTDARTRALLGGGLTAILAMSFNSLYSPCWTIPPLAAFAWLILGAIASPLLAKSLNAKLEATKASLTKIHWSTRGG